METKHHRLVLRSGVNPGTMSIELDGEPIAFVSRVELVVDGDGRGEAKLTIPAELFDLDVDASAFLAVRASRHSCTPRKTTDDD